MRALIRLYQLILSPFVGRHCRYYPSCSEYASQALDRHGAVIGTGLAIWRIFRCQPWGSSGFDPVPGKRTTHPNG
ncbi:MULTISPECIES: membrane protein insertion efficiency factor YidD [Thiorhodovibrio]|jgi:putative membrane protein insertion efficiency factor|uniref:membrane protein insertion efficiency factor YidD n=1 Tax=Thiorhodovibrio TaxID=61593 RepID=UPI001A91BE4C|nr:MULTISPECIES: membrane protein insertion efficiency factor YidD [Thiorhodovibrio]